MDNNNAIFKLAALAAGAIGLFWLAKLFSDEEDKNRDPKIYIAEPQARYGREQVYILCGSQAEAYERARDAGNGAEPIWNPAHKPGDRDHYHPGGSRNSGTNQHFMYGLKKTRADFNQSR